MQGSLSCYSGCPVDCLVNLYSGSLHLEQARNGTLAFASCSEQILWALIQNEMNGLPTLNGRAFVAACSDWALLREVHRRSRVTLHPYVITTKEAPLHFPACCVLVHVIGRAVCLRWTVEGGRLRCLFTNLCLQEKKPGNVKMKCLVARRPTYSHACNNSHCACK